MSIYDQLPQGDYVKWEAVGDKLVGDVMATEIGQSLQGKPVPQLTIRDDEGTSTIVTCSQARLKAEIMKHKPEVGDRISIAYTGNEKREGGKTLKLFEVKVGKGQAKTKPVDTDEEPF